MLHFHFCPTAQCKKNHSNQNPHLISSCRSNGFALLHQRGLSRLSVDSLALHVGFLSQTQEPAVNLAFRSLTELDRALFLFLFLFLLLWNCTENRVRCGRDFTGRPRWHRRHGRFSRACGEPAVLRAIWWYVQYVLANSEQDCKRTTNC